MKYRDFGKTGIKVSEVGFGCWAIGGNEHGNSYGTTDDKTSLEALARAIELGCNFFDTADVYGFGHSEQLLGRALKNKRDRLIIATKVGSDFYQGPGFQTFSPAYIRFALEKSLDRLRTDYVDVYLLHNPPLKVLNKASTYEIFKELKREGKVRAWGVSVFDPIEGLTALKVGSPDCIEAPFSLFNTRPKESLFPAASGVGCAIIAREPLANGFLTGKYGDDCQFETGDVRKSWPRDYIHARVQAARRLAFLAIPGTRTVCQAALKFVLDEPAISVAIAGMKTAEQVEENLAASDLASLSKAEMLRLVDLASRNFAG